MVLGERLVSSYIATLPGFPEELRLRLSHVLISHQGETEYGSPERPKTLEALLVHLIDNLDARAAMYLETTTNVSPGGWSHHENPLRRALYVPSNRQLVRRLRGVREHVHLAAHERSYGIVRRGGDGDRAKADGFTSSCAVVFLVIVVVACRGDLLFEVVDGAAGFGDEAADVAWPSWAASSGPKITRKMRPMITISWSRRRTWDRI